MVLDFNAILSPIVLLTQDRTLASATLRTRPHFVFINNLYADLKDHHDGCLGGRCFADIAN